MDLVVDEVAVEHPAEWVLAGHAAASSLPGNVAAGSGPSRVEARLGARLTERFVALAAEKAVDLADLPRLAAVDPASLSHGGRVELIEAFERVKAVIDGLQQAALAAVVEATEAVGLDGDLARHEVGAALRLSPVTAHRRTRVAADLVRRLPATLAELSAGRIGYLQAAHLAEAVADLPDEVASAVQARVLARAPGQTVAETRRATARAVHAADPAGAADRHDKAAAGRRIERSALPEAMAGWWVAMPAHHEAAAFDALTATARATQQALRAGAGDDPGLDALRVDALLDAIHHQPHRDPLHPDPGAPTDTTTTTDTATQPTLRVPGRLPRCRCGGAQTAAVVVDLPTLLGLAEHAGELPGYGPVPATVARELAADRDWVRWVIDPTTRRLLDRGARRYRPTGRLRAFIAAAHTRCGFPGCPQPAHRCDCDHRTTYRHGGRTIVINLGPLCRQHHNAKTHGHWRVTHDPDTGALTWTSPLGKTYTKSIDPILE